ncbi:uncharacterized protein PAC_16758 [Phialocephala subalpina]|uniref:Uncharacterized protein n=1 Tax=Phialocephala subalpina TaxID=576137 RepID=A0A1L7XPG1_9HELO|nr:uncharacterized protein PAC_16758 [Phialocephala subalpina]
MPHAPKINILETRTTFQQLPHPGPLLQPQLQLTRNHPSHHRYRHCNPNMENTTHEQSESSEIKGSLSNHSLQPPSNSTSTNEKGQLVKPDVLKSEDEGHDATVEGLEAINNRPDLTRKEIILKVRGLEEKLSNMRDALARLQHGGDEVQARGEELQVRLTDVLDELARFKVVFSRNVDYWSSELSALKD